MYGAPPTEPTAFHRWAGALLTSLHRHSIRAPDGSDLPRDTKSERMVDYCDVYEKWLVADPAKNPNVPADTMVKLIRAAVVTPAIAKAQKWGVDLTMPPDSARPDIVNVPACNEASIPKDDSILGEAANVLDDVVRGTARMLGVAEKLLPMILGVMMLSQITNIVSMFGGGGRRR